MVNTVLVSEAIASVGQVIDWKSVFVSSFLFPTCTVLLGVVPCGYLEWCCLSEPQLAFDLLVIGIEPLIAGGVIFSLLMGQVSVTLGISLVKP